MTPAQRDPPLYDRLAESLRGEDEHCDALAGRYLSLRRREDVVQRALRERCYRAVYANPLERCGLVPPLSLADETDWLKGLGSAMAASGVPVAMGYDEKGMHKGTPLADVPMQPAEALRHYGKMMAVRRRLGGRLAALDGALLACQAALARAALERDDAVVTLDGARRACVSLGTSRFMVVVSADAVREVARPVSTLGYAGGPTLRLDGVPVPVEWGHGSGIASVGADELMATVLASVGGSGKVALEFLPTKWRAWDSDAPDAKPRTFAYPSGS